MQRLSYNLLGAAIVTTGLTLITLVTFMYPPAQRLPVFVLMLVIMFGLSAAVSWYMRWLEIAQEDFVFAIFALAAPFAVYFDSSADGPHSGSILAINVTSIVACAAATVLYCWVFHTTPSEMIFQLQWYYSHLPLRAISAW